MSKSYTFEVHDVDESPGVRVTAASPQLMDISHALGVICVLLQSCSDFYGAESENTIVLEEARLMVGAILLHQGGYCACTPEEPQPPVPLDKNLH